MLTRLFDWITDVSVRYKWATIGLTVAVLIAGVLSLNGLNMELVPRVEFPQTVVIIQWPDSESAQMFLDEITIPVEEKLNTIDGVVNVETTTNPTFGAIIVRYDFGEDGDRILNEIETGLEELGLPEEASSQVLNFSLSDLPVIVASASSSKLTLPELKELIEGELQPAAADIEDVSEVATSGGQELPDEEADAVEEEPEEVAEPEPTAEPEDPGKLPAIVVTGAQQLGLDIEYAQDVTVEVLRGIDGTNEQILAVLRLIPDETWRYAPPETLAYLPTEITDNFDAALVAELDELAAEFGGVEQYTVEEAFLAINAPEEEVVEEDVPEEVVIEETEPITPTETVTPTEEVAIALPGVPLPEEWIVGAQAAGQTISTTADITPELMGGIAQLAPESLALLTPEMWRAIDPSATGLVLSTISPTLPITLVQELTAIQLVANGEAPVPIALPPSWIAAAGQAGLTITTTADIPAEAVGQLASFAPQLLADLTPDILLAFSPDVLATLPADYVASLDEGLQQTIANVVIWDVRQSGGEEMVAEEGETVDDNRLPDIIIQGAGQFGLTLEYPEDIDPDTMRLFAGLGEQSAQFLGLLTPNNLRGLPAESIALLPPKFVETLDADLRTELDELAAEFGGAGQLAIQEAEEAATLAEGSPPLSGIWLEPNPEGEPSQFQTAADLINNPFAPTAADLLNFFPSSPNVDNPADWMAELNVEVVRFLAENEETFAETLTPIILELLPPESITYLLDTFPNAYDEELTERLRGVASGDVEVFIPENSVTRTDGNPSVVIQIFKDGEANTVAVAEHVFEFFDEFQAEHPEVTITVAFEQATFIEESIEGVSREGILGAGFAVLIILLFLSGQVQGRYRLSWRATIVTAISIPLSVFTAILLMRWIPVSIGAWAEGIRQSSDSGLLDLVLQLFPAELTLNIMTLSGLTVAIGRVVDDSIVVLENSYRYIQKGIDPREAVMRGTREVAVAIFAATVTTMGVFLPLGLIGGVIGSFFLPFGLTVTYALAASFIVSITVVPALTFLMIRQEHIPEEKETSMQRVYTPLLIWSLNNRVATLAISTVIFIGSLFLLGQLPQSFIPGLGDPTINTVVSLPSGTQMLETNELVEEFEASIQGIEGIETLQTEIGGSGGFEAFFGGGVSQNLANVTASVTDQDAINDITNEVRGEAQRIFGEDNVQVSAASQAGFSGFAVIVTGDDLEVLRGLVPDVVEALESVDMEGDGRQDIANVGSNADDTGGDSEVILRIDGRPAISFSGELETSNTIGVTDAAKQAIVEIGLPAGVEVTEGFDSQQQTEGFQDMVGAIAWSILIVYLIMALTFRSPVHPFTILFSLPFALVGASVALYITNSVLGISAMIGLLMLVGVVVTNGIVLMELVQQLKEREKGTYDALVEAGRTRLRPIWMTALTAILALIPLAASDEAGAIIASELARAVMGGLIVSTALTLVVVPVVYSLFDELIQKVRGAVSRS